MPYEWSTPPRGADPDLTLSLWPHRSLPRRGFAAFVLTTFTLITIPLYPLLGTLVLWGLLPFLLLAVGGVWWALEHSYRTARMAEVLTIAPEDVHLRRTNPRGDVQEWDCNRYWARVVMHPKGGPVPFYITLKGSGREVEIGSFLSEEERKTLYGELADALRSPSFVTG
ncbi:DUF2244 domain-containing protein [uncultured Roseovarius sp.]|uniref:DUF2244 domain-containing protein n=1 Tax=uncultured Roseovarius sp. TaxID=293344 RepID=UPI002633E136|nr:DUF2244 domain-containing protein [uncultured Roseovarius sp.]